MNPESMLKGRMAETLIEELLQYSENSSDAFRPAAAGRGEAPKKILSGFAAILKTAKEPVKISARITF